MGHGAGCSMARTALCGETAGDPSNASSMGPKEKLL